jgi:hypothetical protein
VTYPRRDKLTVVDNKAEMRSGRQTRRTGKRPYGPNIVRAWFDTVFHYILSGLETERGFLCHRNWTFRHHNRTLEYIAPVPKYVPVAAVENLEQFISFFPHAGMLINRHDTCVERLQESCASYADAIVRNTDFLAAFKLAERESPKVLKRDFGANFGAYSSEEDFKKILAEHLVNNIDSLFSYYATAALWKHFGQTFAGAVKGRKLSLLCEAVDRAGCDLIEAGDELAGSMKKIRSELSLEFDVPFVAELTSVR